MHNSVHSFTFALSMATCASAAAQLPDPRPTPQLVAATHSDVKYGLHARNLMDVWLPQADGPAPVLVSIHGGGFRRGEKSVSRALLKGCLESGICVVAITYRFSTEAIAPAQHMDAARAIQFIRHQANRWNLDASRIGCTGGSAGAGISLWLGFHDDLADPSSGDPVLRHSTRLTCMAVNNGQSSYDPRFIRDLFPGSDTHLNSALAQLFDVDLSRLDALPAEKYRLFERISAIHHLSHDDVPVLMTYSSEFDAPIETRSIGIHHPRFGQALKERMDRLGIECRVEAGIPRRDPRRAQLMLAFLREHLLSCPVDSTEVPLAD